MTLRKSVLFLFQVIVLTVAVTAQTRPATTVPAKLPDSLPATEFARLMREFSEDAGFFQSDNLVSNETAFLHITDKLKQLAPGGEAYLGVGPEQNFTYIAKVRPRIAFIIDIRHLAQVQHLMYKAIFHMSPDRVQFLSHLISRPLVKGKAPDAKSSVPDMLKYFSTAPADDKFYAETLAAISRMIEKEFLYSLSESDLKELDYLLSSFRRDGLDISYQTRYSFRSGSFPTMGELIAQTDLHGKYGHFLTSNEDYEFVRGLQMKNLLIPVTGNFAGPKAFSAVGDYLRQHGLTIATFYTSNVEQYLYQYDSFDAFVTNVKKLPVSDRSLFIRAVSNRSWHPASVPGHRLTTLMQLIKVFLSDYEGGKYPTYWSMVTTNYIAAGQE